MTQSRMSTEIPVRRVTIDYFSDVLCIWAFVHQARMDELRLEFGVKIEVQQRFLPLFGANDKRIARGWADRGGYAGYGRNVRDIAAQFDHVAVHPDVWVRNPPPSSMPAHLFLKAIQVLERRGEIEADWTSGAAGRTRFEEAIWRVRREFFSQAANVCDRNVLNRIAVALHLPVDRIHGLIASGEAHAALHEDQEAREEHGVRGSPTLVLNQGRQVLYGNVGYRIIEANIRELLHVPDTGEASWC
jgi:predicted DsbA family dithiol-disulfide isomerase